MILDLIEKVIGASHGYQDDGPRPTAPFFLRPTVAWGPLLGALGFPLMISKVLLRRPSLAWGPLAGLSRLFFRFGVFVFLFVFLFLSVSILVTPLNDMRII